MFPLFSFEIYSHTFQQASANEYFVHFHIFQPIIKMMKFTSVFVAIVVSIFVNAVDMVQAETMVRMIINDGIVIPGLSCSAEDNVLISNVFDRPLNRRNLRSSTIVENSVHPIDIVHEIDQSYGSNDKDRNLQHTASYCRDQCRGMATGYCTAVGCSSYNKKRRQLQNYGKGFASNSTLCRTTADSISSDLDYLVSQSMVSSSCVALLQAPRTMECYEDVMYGIIEQFTIIDADTDTVLVPYLHARRTICGSAALNIEVLVNPCVASVNITLVNKKAGYRATVVYDTTVPGPYTLFGMNGVGDFKGEHLPFGNYTLDGTPDGNFNKTRSRMFYLDSC